MLTSSYDRTARLERLVEEKKREVAEKKAEYLSKHFETAQELSSKIDEIEDPRLRHAVRRVFLDSFSQ